MEFLRKRGHKIATKLLEDGPEFPESLAYLWDMFIRLSSVRGVSFHGPDRITPTLIRDAIVLFEWTLMPQEAAAILDLDFVTLYPDAGEKD